MEDETIRNLDKDFQVEATNKETEITPEAQAEPQSVVAMEQGSSRAVTVPESIFALLHELLAAKGASSAISPPMNPATTQVSPSTLIPPPRAQLIARREQPFASSPPTGATPSQIRQTQKTQLTKGKSKERDYESAEDTNSSSEEMQEIQKERDNPAGPNNKEAYIRQQLEELEHTLRNKEQSRPQPSAKTVTYARPEGHKRYRANTEGEPSRSKTKATPNAWAPPRLRQSPFSPDILADPLPTNYKPIPLEYDGKDDPSIHMARFEGMVMLHQYSEGIKCRIFSTTLVGMAQRWFQKLEERSIWSYEDLYEAFMHQFASSQKAGKNAMSLMELAQEPDESLREYVARFNMTSLEIPDAEEQLKTYAFIKGLNPGALFDSLYVDQPRDFGDLLARIPGYIQLEEAKALRKMDRENNKPRPPKNEGNNRNPPPRGLPPRTSLRPEEPQPLSRYPPRIKEVAAVETPGPDLPLNRSLKEIFNILRDEPFFGPPPQYVEGPPSGPPSTRVCLYHNQ